MTLTKKDIISSISKRSGFSKAKAMSFTETTLEIIKNRLESGEDVLISGFGKFCIKENHEKNGRSLENGNYLPPGARRLVIFKPSLVLKEKII